MGASDLGPAASISVNTYFASSDFQNLGEVYLICLYFVCTVFTTVGFGLSCYLSSFFICVLSLTHQFLRKPTRPYPLLQRLPPWQCFTLYTETPWAHQQPIAWEIHSDFFHHLSNSGFLIMIFAIYLYIHLQKENRGCFSSNPEWFDVSQVLLN